MMEATDKIADVVIFTSLAGGVLAWGVMCLLSVIDQIKNPRITPAPPSFRPE